jgi:hypothetical protein
VRDILDSIEKKRWIHFFIKDTIIIIDFSV